MAVVRNPANPGATTEARDLLTATRQGVIGHWSAIGGAVSVLPLTGMRSRDRDAVPHTRLSGTDRPATSAAVAVKCETGDVPELPEVESARAAIERAGLGRKIADVDDTDTYECRPHAPGEIRDALVGRRLVSAHRQGKFMWCDTSGVGRSRTPGPELAIHLGMSGRIVITSPSRDGSRGATTEGGDYVGTRDSATVTNPRNPAWNRFTLTFADGGQLRLFDKRRLGRVRIDADRSALGPDAQDITVAQFRERLGRGHSAVKARLLDQSVVAGVGNLLADETLWQAGIAPTRAADELDDDELAALRRALRKSTRAAITHGGVHTGTFIAHRSRDGHCPRCGAEVKRATVGGRTTYWCPQEQH